MSPDSYIRGQLCLLPRPEVCERCQREKPAKEPTDGRWLCAGCRKWRERRAKRPPQADRYCPECGATGISPDHRCRGGRRAAE